MIFEGSDDNIGLVLIEWNIERCKWELVKGVVVWCEDLCRISISIYSCKKRNSGMNWKEGHIQ